MPIESDNNDAIESPQYHIHKTEENEPVKADSTAPPKPDSALKKGLHSLETIVFKILSGLMLVAGLVLLWQALKLGGFLFDAGNTQNPLIGFGSIIGLFFALSIAGIGLAMIVGSVFAWTGSLMVRARKSSNGSRVGLAILVVFFIFVIKPEGEDLKSNAAGTLDLLAALAAESKKSYPNGQIRESESTTDGEINGLTVKLSVKSRYYDNGQMSDESRYTDGERQGLQTEWHRNGQKSSEETYVNDSPVGTKTSWYDNGQKRSEDIYRTESSRSTTSWHENGQKKSEENHVLDLLDGTLTTWYANGQKRSEVQMERGREIGDGKHWTEAGEPTTQQALGHINDFLEH